MNEQLESIKKLATIKVNNPTVNSNGKIVCDNWEEGVSLSKFAELIVQKFDDILLLEYLDCVSNKDKSATERTQRLREKVRIYFGVEE